MTAPTLSTLLLLPAAGDPMGSLASMTPAPVPPLYVPVPDGYHSCSWHGYWWAVDFINLCRWLGVEHRPWGPLSINPAGRDVTDEVLLNATPTTPTTGRE